MLGIAETEFVGDFADRLRRVEYPFLGDVDHLQLNVLLRRFAGLLLYQVAEIVGRQVQLFRAPAYRRHPVALGRVAFEIVVQQPFEPGQRVFVDLAARDELPLVEAYAVVEQQFDVRDDQPSAVLVDGMVQFARYVLQAFEHHEPLLLREMQGLVGFVRKEGVFVHAASERRAPDQVGVEQQRPAFGLKHLAVVLDADHLPRCDEYERSLLIVVIVASVAHVAAFDVFQEDAVESVHAPGVPGLRAFRKVDDADQRMERLLPHHFVVLVDVLHFYDLVHMLRLLLSVTKLMLFSMPAAPSRPNR